MTTEPRVLILTPVKDATSHLERYFANLGAIDYPREALSLGMIESDSQDDTWERLQGERGRLEEELRCVTLCRRDFDYHIPRGRSRWSADLQVDRRSALARSRNHLLSRALGDEEWVLWLDVDVIEYPPDIIRTLLGTGKDIVTPNCVREPGGRSYDRNAWRDRGRRHLHDLRNEGDLVRLDSVGGTMLLVRADLHRDGLVFPPFLYGKSNPRARHFNRFVSIYRPWRVLEGVHRGEIETEGLAMMAHDMGYECWGMPNVEVIHHHA
jgi:peptide chain release factor subunit 1